MVRFRIDEVGNFAAGKQICNASACTRGDEATEYPRFFR